MLCLRIPFETTAMLFLLALFAGKLAASLSKALLYLSGSITTPGVFRIFGLVKFLKHAGRLLSIRQPRGVRLRERILHARTGSGCFSASVLP